MARKSNKTSHVLHLLAGEEPVPGPSEKKEEPAPAGSAEAVGSEADKEAPAEQAGTGQDMPNISIISTGNSEDDPVADLIKEQLEEDFPEDILEPQSAARADHKEDSGSVSPAENEGDASDVPSADNDTPDSDKSPADSDIAALEKTPADSLADEPKEIPADSPMTGPERSPADSLIDGSEETPAVDLIDKPEKTLADSLIDGPEEIPADSLIDEPEESPADNLIAEPERSPADSLIDGLEETPADSPSGPPADGSISDTAALSADDDIPAGGSDDPALSPAPIQADMDDTDTVDTTSTPGQSKENYSFVNVMEYIVKDLVIDYMKKFDMCTCERCVVDTMALALTYCPAKYIVVDSHTVSPLLNYYSNRYVGDVTVELTKACIKIKDNPRH